jgi:hypothetical protein
MTYSEQILEELIKIADENRSGLLEAASDYCVENDLDEVEFISGLDPFVILRLKEDAVSEGKVRKCVQPKRNKLF